MSDPADAVFVPRSADTWRDPFPMYRALRDHDPVHYVEDGDYWALSRFRDIHDAAIDSATWSSADGLTFTYGEMAQLGLEAPIVMMDPPDHTAVRKLITKRFTPRQVTDLEPMVRAFVAERIEKVREMGDADIVAEVFKPLPSLVVAHFLGVPEEDRGRFDGWTDAIVAANASGDFGDAGAAVGDLMMYFAGLIEERRQRPQDDMVTAMVQGSIGGEPVSPAKMLGVCFTMVAGGNDTTTGLLSVATELLTRNPDQKKLLANEPGRIKGAIEEFLRLTSPVQGLARLTTRDVTMHGKTIPSGKKVMLLYASANRDEREFGDDAGELDVTRNVKRHMAFSYGPHHCIGAAAARLQARVALEELLAHCPDFVVHPDRGQFASGHFVRRYESLPISAQGA